jgi:hypothetical protein
MAWLGGSIVSGQGGADDAGVHAHAPYCLVVDVGFDVGGGCGVGAGGHGVFVVVQDPDRDAELAVECLDEGGEGPNPARVPA